MNNWKKQQKKKSNLECFYGRILIIYYCINNNGIICIFKLNEHKEKKICSRRLSAVLLGGSQNSSQSLFNCKALLCVNKLDVIEKILRFIYINQLVAR